MLLYLEDEARAALAFARAAGLPAAAVRHHRFPDGETRLQLPAALPARVVLWRSLHPANDRLVELMLIARTARTLGAERLCLIAPYLAYMRQDIAFEPGEAISQRIVGRYIADLFDALITVDPHLHRVATLREAVPLAQAVALSGAPALGDWIAQQRPQALLVGPDEESAQWVAQAAARHGFAHAVCRKQRHGDHEVSIALPPVAVRGRAVVLIDDVASTGQTVAQAARALRQAGAASVDVAVTHALFAGDALQRLQQAGVGAVWSTDCIAHPSNVVAMAPDLARAYAGLG